MTFLVGQQLVSRRSVLSIPLVVGFVGVSGCAAPGSVDSDEAVPIPAANVPEATSPFGTHQAGIVLPAVPQRFALVTVFTCDETDSARVVEALRQSTRMVAQFQEQFGEAHNLTVTYGVGPRMATNLFRDSDLVTDLPVFAREELTDRSKGGDVFVQICCDEPTMIDQFAAAVFEKLEAVGAKILWSQWGFRGNQTDAGVNRNLLGFHDGIINPRTQGDLDESVWIEPDESSQGSDTLEGASVVVVRRIRLDRGGFAHMGIDQQEQTIGRDKITGAPLNGGDLMDEVGMSAKTPAGKYIVPATAHARVAHPSNTGFPIMLRRGYGYLNSEDDAGLLFICFQKNQKAFEQTQFQMDQKDALMNFMTCTASGAFLILPGVAP